MKQVYRTLFVLLLGTGLFSLSCKEDTLTPETFGSITGVVRDNESNVSLEGASVTTNPPSAAIVTNADGAFLIENIPVGNYVISAVKSGYKKGAVSISVKEEQITSATILLERSSTAVAPGRPTNPVPSHQSSNQPVAVALHWQVEQRQASDSLRFDVYLYESNSPSALKIATDLSDTTFEVTNLKYSTTYFWQVVAKDTGSTFTNGNLWSFSTKTFPNNRIVFASARDGNYEIYSCDSTGGNLVRLTTNAARDWWPRLSPRYDKIAYTSDATVPPHIYTMNRDGSATYKLTTVGVAGYHNYGIGISWSPDGTKLLYSNYNRLYRVDAVGGNLVHVATAPAGRNFRESHWSPVGDKLVALAVGENAYDSEIYSMSSDGSNQQLLVGNLPGIIEAPVFSLDGGSILYTRDVSGLEVPDGRQLDSHIFLKRISGTDTTIDLSLSKPSGTNDSNPRFSPDGSKIIFTNRPNDDSQPADVWMMESNGTGRRMIIANGTMPDWR